MTNLLFLETGVSLNGNPLEVVDIFCYLGSMVDSSGGTEADIKARIGKARTAFAQLKKIWKSSIITRKTKMRLFNAIVMSVLLYGCQTWKTTSGIIKKLQTFVNKCLRIILKSRWYDLVSNKELWERAAQAPIKQQIAKRKWRWIGHTLRKPAKCIARQALKWNPQGSRSRKRPKETWRRCVEREMAQKGLTWGELTATAQDRQRWKLLVSDLSSVTE